MYRNRLKWLWFLLLWRRTRAVSYRFTMTVGSTIQTPYRQILMKAVSSISLVLCPLYTCKTEGAAHDICKRWYSVPHVWPCCMSCDATLVPKRKQQGVMGNTSIKIANNFILFCERCCKEKNPNHFVCQTVLEKPEKWQIISSGLLGAESGRLLISSLWASLKHLRYGIGQASYPRVPETSLDVYLVATEIPYPLLKTGAQTPRLYWDTYDQVAEAHPCFLSHALHFSSLMQKEQQETSRETCSRRAWWLRWHQKLAGESYGPKSAWGLSQAISHPRVDPGPFLN